MPEQRVVNYRGTFAPPLSDEKIAQYKTMIAALPADSQVRDVMTKLLNCCNVWWNLPDPKSNGDKPHPMGIGQIVNLEATHAKSLWEHIPWDEELDVFAKVLDSIPNDTQKPLRDAAHHLLWHVRELALDREPLTKDKLGI